MGKQKTIIYSLEKEVDSNRKNRRTEELVKKIVNEELKEIKSQQKYNSNRSSSVIQSNRSI